MNSFWPPALASLDDSLTLPCESLGKLNAGLAIDIADVTEQLNLAAESARMVRELVLSELPEASWQNRQELDALIEEIRKTVEARNLEQRRSRLLALATELERGSIVHRRALRVNELNQLRDQAIDELRSQAGPEGAPPPLPGPEADQWVEWACGLKEPEDSESLQTLRNGFAHLDDFVASLEPDMWTVPDASAQKQAELEALIAEEAQKNLRSRLSALATELERGSIVHHRAFRVTQLNELRDQAINELRSQAEGTEAPQTLPGPEAEQWIGWACGLKEPEDAESLQTLRDGFTHLDDFVANLEPDMWIAAGSPTLETPAEAERSADNTQQEPSLPETPPEQSWPEMHQEPSRVETNGFEETLVSSGPIPIKLKARRSSKWRRVSQTPHSPHSVETSHPAETPPSALEPETVVSTYVAPVSIEEEVQQVPAQKVALLNSIKGLVTDPVRRMKHAVEPPVTTEVFREASAVAAIPNHQVESPFTAEIFRETSATPTTTSDIRTRVQELFEGKSRMLLAVAAVLVLIVLGALMWRSHRNHVRSALVSASESKTPGLTPSNPGNKLQDQPVMASDSNPPADKQSKPKDQSAASKPTTPAGLEKPASKPDNAVLQPPLTVAKNEARKEEAKPVEAVVAPVLGLSGKVPGSLVSSIPTAQPKLAPTVQVSSGVAQGLLVHQVTPRYPAQARQARVQGTVVLQALIGKDGSVRNLHALSGPPMLTQAAVDAVKQWKYKPYYLDGQPVEAETQINVKFTP
ncbi:MAG: TonB family protein [Terriglobales bacterium]